MRGVGRPRFLWFGVSTAGGTASFAVTISVSWGRLGVQAFGPIVPG